MMASNLPSCAVVMSMAIVHAQLIPQARRNCKLVPLTQLPHHLQPVLPELPCGCLQVGPHCFPCRYLADWPKHPHQPLPSMLPPTCC
uniref:Alternative protein CCDC71 n=1 Tax=Homo sapiens TaxID=9606 RepID=L8E8R9_HUMAN|nr:alternative protein CCDC71 [Homo sapiens]